MNFELDPHEFRLACIGTVILMVLVAILLSFGLTGCGSTAGPDGAPKGYWWVKDCAKQPCNHEETYRYVMDELSR